MIELIGRGWTLLEVNGSLGNSPKWAEVHGSLGKLRPNTLVKASVDGSWWKLPLAARVEVSMQIREFFYELPWK